MDPGSGGGGGGMSETPLLSSPSAVSGTSNVIGIFWDIENCAVPHGKSAAKVVEKIRSMPFYASSKAEMDFLVVCDVTKESEEIVNELNTAQVTVQHVTAAKKKNAADEKLRQAMRKFVDHALAMGHAGRRTTVVLISGDADFLSDLSDFKHRKSIRVVLLHNGHAAEPLLKAAHETYDFHKMLEDVPAR